MTRSLRGWGRLPACKVLPGGGRCGTGMGGSGAPVMNTVSCVVVRV